MNKKISLIIILIVILISLIPIKSNAVTPIDSAYIYANKKTDYMLIRQGIKIHADMAVYKKDGKEYPAYCMNRGIPGVEVGFSQTVDVKQLVNNVMVWKVIINGYPYKTISELGCKTEEEAYLATKQAVYCVLTNTNLNDYSTLNEGGERVLKALKEIISNAKNSTATKVSSELKVNQKDSMWKVDNIDKNYISQTFKVTANASFDKYTVELKNLNIEGVKIVNEKNEEKREFNSSENFKILVPITNILDDGNFTINVLGKVATKPIFYGESRDSGLQNYALTGYMYEDGEGTKRVYYNSNETKIKIIKKDDTGKLNLQGVQFELLDQNKNTIYTDLITDENGQVVIDNLLPGTYYIKETRTIEGYELYNKLIKVELDLNEETTVNIVNSKEEPNIEIDKKESETTVKGSKSEKIVENNIKNTQKKLPKTGM